MTRKEQNQRRAAVVREVKSGKSLQQAAIDHGLSYAAVYKMTRHIAARKVRNIFPPAAKPLTPR